MMYDLANFRFNALYVIRRIRIFVELLFTISKRCPGLQKKFERFKENYKICISPSKYKLK